MSPRPFERPATIALPNDPTLPPGASLEGLWLPARGEEGARGGAVVAPPHPQMGGSMDSPVATEIALAASDQAFVSVRFNWRGVGASAGVPSGDAADSVTDYSAALDFVEASVEGPILAGGYSWGAVTAAKLAVERKRISRLILVAPPASMLDAGALKALGKPLLVIAGDRDEYVPIEPIREIVDSIEGAQLEVLEGVDHFFMAGLADVGRIIRGFLGPA